MGSSGLLYAAIVAAWAAVLVPRWIRRNEEIDRAREEDTSRGVRVLDRQQRHARAHSGLSADREPPARRPPTADGADATTTEPPADPPSIGRSAAARRRRVLTLLLVTLGGTMGGAAAGVIPAGLVTVPGVLLLVFLVLARWAAATEARRRRAAARREAMRRRALAAEQPAEPAKRVAVLDDPTSAASRDPNAWDPVPVPRPTYLTKPRAEPRVVRKIDLSSPGAWTSGRLNPDSAVVPPPQPAERSDVRERRRAVGD
ncbi:MAG: hypothetical protein ACOC96_07075 [Actinomycetota bacterium]